jgi:GTPase
MDHLPENYRSGFVAVVGRPSVGKSTLVNTLLKQKIASVSPRPQTTRRKQLAIYTSDAAQIIFMDTPGIHQPVHKLGEYLNQVATDTLQDADVILWLVDASVPPQAEDTLVVDYLKATPNLPPVVLVLNKIDQIKGAGLAARREQYATLFPATGVFEITALAAASVQSLLEWVAEHLPIGFRYYDPEQVTDLYERDIAIDLIREAVLKLIKDEVPHAVAVRLDEYYDEGETKAHIGATLMVERDSQKGILIGQGGQMIKQIGILARKEIEAMTDRTIYLELRVKVQKNWRNDINYLKLLGYIPSSHQE